jgi:SAM-dependent methyltransferase
MVPTSLRSLRGRLRREPPPAEYSYQPADTVVADFAQFAGLTVGEAETAIRSYRKAVEREWRALGRGSFRRRSEAFYSASDNYVFDIVEGTRNKQLVKEKVDKFNPRLLGLIQDHPGERLLDFGGGTGVFCEIAHELGKQVTYLDVPGRVSDFARWRFAKYQLPIEIQITSPVTPTIAGAFDIVFSDAVLEHLPSEKQLSVVDEMCRATTADGLLILLVDLSGPTRDNPTHSAVDLDAVHRRLASNQFVNVEGARRFCSIWQKAA